MQNREIKRRDTIAVRLIIAIVGFSSFIAIFTTAVQLFVDYRQSIDRIDRDLAYVKAVNLAPISKSLWDLAEETIQLQLDSLISHPEIEFVAIHVDGRIVWHAGQEPDGDVIAVQYPLVYSSGVLDRDLGTIEIVAGLSNIYQQLFENAIVILGTNLLKTLAVAAFMYFLFHMYITRHLIALADHARRIGLMDSGDSFRFAGMSGEDQREDELGYIASAMEQMRTNLKESYDGLAESEKNFRYLIEDSAQGYFIHEDRCPVFVNPALAEMFGYEDSNEVLGLSNVQELFASRERQRLTGYYKTRLKGEAAPTNYEVEGVRKDGAPIWLNVSTQLVNWQGKRMIGTNIIDISERKRAEAALRDSEARLSKATEMAKIGYWVWDEIENKSIYCSDEMAKMYGVSTGAELSAMTISHAVDLDWVHPEDRERVEQAMQTSTDENRGFDIEHRIINVSGEVRNLHVIEEPIYDEQGQLIRSSGTTQDITELKQAEEEIRKLNADLEHRVEARTAELREAQAGLLRQERLAVLGQLTATVSHELRNPLGVIRTSAYVARENQNNSEPRVVRALERIERSVIRCDRIIDELLDFTRISTPDPESTYIDAGLAETLSEQHLPGQIELNWDFGLPDTVVPFDRDRLRRAVINVFDNACQAMTSEDGMENADLKLPVLTVATRNTNDRVELIFEDSGPGIPDDMLVQIFEPLFSTKGFGVGLGLPVVKQIMEQHQGGVEIESEEGRGTRVCLWLPHDQSNR